MPSDKTLRIDEGALREVFRDPGLAARVSCWLCRRWGGSTFFLPFDPAGCKPGIGKTFHSEAMRKIASLGGDEAAEDFLSKFGARRVYISRL